MSILAGASNIVVRDSNLIHNVAEGSRGVGLEKLREASTPGVAYDSSERYPPPVCHPGTREEDIEQLIKWGLNAEGHTERVAWVKGPAGVGKSAVAQSCAEVLHLKKKLGATFFFSRSHNRDDPDRFFTTLASQLAGRHRTYSAHINLEIQHNPDLVKTSLPHQFRGLFVTPLADPQIKGEVDELVIIVDGLDECASKEAQVAIIKIVAESARKETTPFLWIFLSRLEPKIVMTFDLPEVKSVSQQTDVPVSRVIDPQIQRYLVDKLQEIGCEHGLPLPWPSERAIKDLVNFSAGLFACAHAITLFASADDPAGPEELLRAVLELAERSVTRSSDHRLSALDELYKLIMVHVPASMLQTVQWILLTTRVRRVQYARQSARLSGLSHVQWRKASGCLHSVMKVGVMDWTGITFYHKSFMDFIEHPTSGPFHIWSDCAITLLEEVLRHLNQIRVVYLGKGQYLPRLNLTSSDSSSEDYVNHIMAFFWVLSSAALNHNARAARALKDFDFRKFCFRSGTEFFISERNLFMQNLHIELKLVHRRPLLKSLASVLSKDRNHYYTIGRGEKRALLKITEDFGSLQVEPYSPRLFEAWTKQLHAKVSSG